MPGGLCPFLGIPILQLAKTDGEPIIAVLESGATVRGVIGPQTDDLVLTSLAF
jgi:hypothetical protein